MKRLWIYGLFFCFFLSLTAQDTEVYNVWETLELTGIEIKIPPKKPKIKKILIPIGSGIGVGGIIGGIIVATRDNGTAPLAPTAIADQINLNCGQSSFIDVLNNDTGEGLSIDSFNAPAGVNVTQSGSGFNITASNTGYSFTYTIIDVNGLTSMATVSVVVDAEAINAVDDNAETSGGAAVSVSVLDNDTGDNLSIISFTNSDDGNVIQAGDNLFFTPNTGFCGTATFSYTIADECEQQASATVSVVVDAEAINAIDDNAETSSGAAVSVAVLDNDTGDNLSIISFTNSDDGNVIQAGDNLFFTPDAGFCGTATFSYTIADECEQQASATVSVVVDAEAINAADDNTETSGGTAVSVSVLDNDTGDNLSIISFTNSDDGNVIQAGDNLFFTPDAGFCGTATFSYTIADECEQQASATVSINVDADLQANNDNIETNFEQNLQFNPTTNDVGIDIIIDNFPSTVEGGTLIQIDANTLQFNPNAGYSGTFSFSYTIIDACNQTSSATITIVVSENDCNYTVSITSTPANCGLKNGTAEVEITPAGNFEYNWSSGETGANAVGLGAETHSLTITDTDNGCILNETVIIDEIPNQYFDIGGIIPAICAQPGEILLSVNTPGSGPVEIQVAGNGGTIDLIADNGDFLNVAPLGADIYTITAIDLSIGAECVYEIAVQVDGIDQILDLILIDAQPPSNPGNNDGFIVVEVANPVSNNFTFVINGQPFNSSQPQFFFNNLGYDEYVIEVFDDFGCTGNPLIIDLLPPPGNEKKWIELSLFAASPFLIGQSIPFNKLSIEHPLALKHDELYFTPQFHLGMTANMQTTQKGEAEVGINCQKGTAYFISAPYQVNSNSYSLSIQYNHRLSKKQPLFIGAGAEQRIVQLKTSKENVSQYHWSPFAQLKFEIKSKNGPGIEPQLKYYPLAKSKALFPQTIECQINLRW